MSATETVSPFSTIADSLAQGWSAQSAKADVHIVSGKGGTGKTTVAVALALALARSGKKVLLVEVEERQGIARAFDRNPLPYREELVARVDRGGGVYALAIDIEAAMLDYLDTFYRLAVVGKAMKSVGAIEFATTIAPGLKDVLLTGKVYEVATRSAAKNEIVYDAVVVDAPPTGRIGKFLDVTNAMVDLAAGGPIRRQAESVVKLIHSPRTVVHLVTLLESLPVQETLEAIVELESLGIRTGQVLINRAGTRYFDDADIARIAEQKIDAASVLTGLEAAGLDSLSDEDFQGLLVETIEHARVASGQLRAAHELADTAHSTMVLPALNDGVNIAGLHALATSLIEQGVH